MKKALYTLIFLVAAICSSAQQLIRVLQIEPIQGTYIKSLGETVNKVLTTNGSGGAIWQIPATWQTPLNGTGFVKMTGTTPSYDNTLVNSPVGFAADDLIPLTTGNRGLKFSEMQITSGFFIPNMRMHLANYDVVLNTMSTYSGHLTTQSGSGAMLSDNYYFDPNFGGMLQDDDLLASAGIVTRRAIPLEVFTTPAGSIIPVRHLRVTTNGNVLINTTTDNAIDKLQVNGSATFSGQIKSSVGNGTAPLTVLSTTLNTNLNADLLDGQHASYYQKAYTNAVSLTDAPYGQTKLETPTIANLLFAGDDRFLITTTGFSYVDTVKLFDNNYDQYTAAQINTNNTAGTITVDLTAKGEYSTLVYPQGNIYVNFYNNATPDSVKVRYKSKDGGAVFNWSPYYIGTNIASGNSKLFKVALGGSGYYCNIIEIVIKSGTLSALTDPPNLVAVSEIEYIPARSIDYRATTLASKTATNYFYGDAIWKNSLNQSKVSIISETGNVGIGTAVPGEKLEVFSTGTTNAKVKGNYAQMMLQVTSDANYSNLGFLNTAGLTQGYIKYDFSNNAMSFRVAGINDVLFIKSNGYVGIGTAAPDEKLEVNGKTKTATFQMTTGPFAGYVMTSDVSGNGTWAAKPSYTASEVGAISTSHSANAITGFGASGTATTVARSDDARFTNSRPASDVSAWAKSATKPAYTASDITDFQTAVTANTNVTAAYNDRPTAVAVSSGIQKTITITQGDATTLTSNFTDEIGSQVSVNGAMALASPNLTNSGSISFVAVGNDITANLNTIAGLTPGDYTNANIRVGNDGRVSLASSGTGGSMVYPGVGIALSSGSNSWSGSIANNSASWNTAYSERATWDGGTSGLVAGTGRTSLSLEPAAITQTSTNTAISGSHSHAMSIYGTPSNGNAITYNSTYGFSWGTIPTPGGSSTYVQYNNGTTFAGNASFTFNSGTGVVTATNFGLSSDKRLKRSIQPIGENQWVDDIHFKSFYMNNDLTGRLRYGVIAQELEKVNPYLVTTGENGYKAVSYIDLLVAKVARQDEILNRLIKKIEKLEKHEN